MKGFNRIWRFLPSSPKVSVGDLLSLLFLNNDRFPTTALGNDNKNKNGNDRTRIKTLRDDDYMKKGGILKLVQDLPLGLLAVALP